MTNNKNNKSSEVRVPSNGIKIIFNFFLVVFTLSFLVFNLSDAQLANAQEKKTEQTEQKIYQLSVPIPTKEVPTGIKEIKNPAEYIKIIYQFSLGIGALLAVAMIVFGGIEYTVSAGNVSKQQEARDRILNAIYGLALLMGAVLILYTINPNLVKLGLPTPAPPPPKPEFKYGYKGGVPTYEEQRQIFALAKADQENQIKAKENEIQNLKKERDKKNKEIADANQNCQKKKQDLTVQVESLNTQIATEQKELAGLKLGLERLKHSEVNIYINEELQSRILEKYKLLTRGQYDCVRYRRSSEFERGPGLKEKARFKEWVFQRCSISPELFNDIVIDDFIDKSLVAYKQTFQEEEFSKQITEAEQKLADQKQKLIDAQQKLAQIETDPKECLK